MRCRFYNIATILLVIMITASLQICRADNQPSQRPFHPRADFITNDNSKRTATVIINNHPAFTIITPWGGSEPQQRADIIVRRLLYVFENYPDNCNASYQMVNKDSYAIIISGGALVIVTKPEATAHKTTVAKLAMEWTAAINNLIRIPPLVASVKGIVVPFGESRSFKVTGAARATDIAAVCQNGEIASSQFDPGTHNVTVSGISAGQTLVVIQTTSDGAAEITIPVIVMKYAAEVSTRRTISVTGSPEAESQLVARALYSALSQAIISEPKAHVIISKVPKHVTSLPLNHERTYVIETTASGNNLLPVKTKTKIEITNSTLDKKNAASLLYSNDPERVTDARLLYNGRVYPEVPVRLDFHHQNVAEEAFTFHVDLVNNSSEPQSAQIIAGIATPAVDTIQVGRRAGAEFMNLLESNSGLVIKIPPYSRIPIVTQRFPSLCTVSGIIQIRQITSEHYIGIEVSTDKVNDFPIQPMNTIALNNIGSSWGVGTIMPLIAHANEQEVSPYVFHKPTINIDTTHQAGGPWTFVRLGHNDSLSASNGSLSLDGNYGADYMINLTVTNPTQAQKTVGLYFAPEAGTAAGVFQIDKGPFVEFDPTSPPQEPIIEKVVLEPGEKRTLHIWTIPLNGSYYPASIIIHAI